MGNKIRLNVIGISNSQTTSGAYALILGEENGKNRIPIIIGGYEAQAIAIQLEGLKPPRPLTHDLFTSFAKVYKIKLLDVQIYKIEEGIFFSKLHFSSEDKESYVDSRTSDAVAIALRFKAPIFTTKEIIDKAGITLDINDERSSKSEEDELDIIVQNRDEDHNTQLFDSYSSHIKTLTIPKLKELLAQFIDQEDYEKASMIRDEIERRKTGI